jgi:hypothetical protein
MATDELAARRWFRQRLDELGEQHPELQTLEARERLTTELARQAREGEDMAENSVRPKGDPRAARPQPWSWKPCPLRPPWSLWRGYGPMPSSIGSRYQSW